MATLTTMRRNFARPARRSLIIALCLIGGFMVVEVLGGIFSGSLALLADAGHMLTDAASIALALVAVWIAGRLESIERTFGYQRTEVLAAAFVLHSGSKHSLNVDGAFKHVLADLMGFGRSGNFRSGSNPDGLGADRPHTGP